MNDKSDIDNAAVILLIEDDDGHADLIKWSLEKAGIKNTLHHIDNGQKALAWLTHQGNYADHDMLTYNNLIVLLDINMPIMDGYEVLETIRSCTHTRHLPVIMLTTTEGCEEVARCYKLGCNQFLKKPVDHKDLITTIQQFGTILFTDCVPPVKGS